MNKNKQLILVALAFSLMSPCVAHEQVQTAAKAALENVTGGKLGKLYKVRSQAETPDRREMIVKACVAGLYAIGDTKNAKKINQGENRDGFIDSLMKECDLCYGEGRSQEGCYKCQGSGACKNRKCSNGTVTSAGFDGRSNVRKCSNCGGSGKCTNCKGTGKVARTCSRCNGSKRVIDKSIALASCKDMLNALVACGNEIQSRKKAEGATQLAQQMVEKEKQAREKAESQARLAEQGAQNEKLQREQAEEREKKAPGGAVAIPNSAKVGGRSNVVMPTNARSLKEAFPNSYKTIESVVIQDGVTRIEGCAFKDCSCLRSVTIPNGVTQIDYEAFSGCCGLTSVTIPDSVTHIYGSAFEGCTGLTSVVIPDSVTYFDTCAFADCSGLTKVVIGKNVRSFGSDLFKGCSEVTSVTLPARKRLSSMFPDAYETIQSVVIQDGGTSIEDSAFSGCSGLTNVTIPKGVTSIGSLAFEGCTALTSVEIPDSVTDIGYSAFEGCVGLTSVVIPDSLKEISHSAFKGCIGLTSVRIPDNVKSIDNFTFGDCSGLTKVVIGKNVTSIYDAFRGCSGVTSVTMPSRKRLSSVFPDAYESIQSVVIQDGETSIVHGAFEGCTGLTSVTIPRSVTSIEYGAFSGCSGLTNVMIPRSMASIGNGAFEGCTGLTSVTIPDSVTSIGCGAFKGCIGLTSVVIPNSVTTIDNDAFSGCLALTSVTLPQTLEKLGSSAFAGCEKLASFGNKEFKGGDISTTAFAGTQYTVIDIDGVKCIKSTKDADQIKQNAKFKEKLAKIASERKCIDDYCEIIANGLTVGVVKRKPEGFNYTVAGKCNGVASTRLYYKNRWGETLTEDVGWSHDFSYLILSDEDEWANWMDALKVVHEKVIEWVDVAVKNDIDKMEKEIPIGRIEVLAHNNMVTKGKGQQELYVSAIRERERPDTPVKFFCKMSRSDYQKDKGEHSGGVTARCGYFEHEILRFSGDKTRISNDISLLIERYNPAALKKAYLEHSRKQDMFK